MPGGAGLGADGFARVVAENPGAGSNAWATGWLEGLQPTTAVAAAAARNNRRSTFRIDQRRFATLWISDSRRATTRSAAWVYWDR